MSILYAFLIACRWVLDFVGLASILLVAVGFATAPRRTE